MTEKTGKNLKYLRESNEAEILKFLTINAGGSRMELSKKMGLSKMTISNIVTELIEKNYLVEKKNNSKETMSMTGPKPMMLSIKRDRILAIGVYVSGENIQCALSDIVNGVIILKEERIIKADITKTFISQIAAVIDKILLHNPLLNKNIIGIGMSFAGRVDAEKGILVKSSDFLEIERFDIKKAIQKQYDYPVFIVNNMQASALAEQLYGHGRKYSDFVYVGITDAVGASVVSGNRLMSGSRGFAAEAGHMSINYQGELCNCGNRGCLELYTSIPALLKKTNSSTLSEIITKFKKGDTRTIMTMESFIRIIGIAFTNLINIFDPSCIIVGYEGAVLAELVLNKIERLVNSNAIIKNESKTPIYISSFKEQDAIRGATALIFQKLFDGHISL